MKWPSMDDYRTALQDPSRAFRDPRLKGCAVDCNPRTGIPRGSAGRNAVVYKLTDGSGKVAARVFRNEPPPGRQKRTAVIHDYLATRKLGCLVDFAFDPGGVGIFDPGTQTRAPFPILTMDWVEGETLGSWFRAAVARGDTKALSQMGDAWVELVGELKANGIAHGDLQHGNVMVRNGRCVLVDYDGMYVPTMTSPADLVAEEAGLPGYQHPAREGRPLSPQLDDFSAWVILIALKAVAADPDLWHRYPGVENREELLLGEQDIYSHANSPLWDELTDRAKDPKVRAWAKALRQSLDGPFEKIPPFGVDVFDELRVSVAAKDWRAVRALATGKYAARAFPPDLAAEVNEADRRVGCLDALAAKVKGGNVREVARAYRPELLDDWADPVLLDQARRAVAAVESLDALAAAEQSDPTGRALLAAWDAAADGLKGVGEGDEFREKAASCWRRIDAAGQLAAALADGRPDREVAAAWADLEALGGHPDADPHRAAATEAARRVRAADALSGVPETEDEETDRAFLKAWLGSGSLLDGRPEADRYRRRADAARERLKGVDLLARRIAEADAGPGRSAELALIEAAEALPPGYGGGHAARVAVARRRLAAAGALNRALRADPPSDLKIAAAAEALRGDPCWPTDPSAAARCELALRRAGVLRALDAIPSALALDAADAQWVAAWDESLLADCRDAESRRPRHAEAVARVAKVEAIEAAIAGRDPLAVKRLHGDPALAGHPLLERRRDELTPLVEAGARLERLLGAAESGRPDDFFAEADASFVSEHLGTFAPYRDRLEGWLDARLAAGGLLRPATPVFLPGATRASVTARWAWERPDLVRVCLVAADPNRFLDKPSEAKGGALRLDPETHRRSHSGAILAVPEGAPRLHVTVWPTADLGWGPRTGPPVKLGTYSASTNGRVRNERRRRSLGKVLRDWLVSLLNS